MKTKQQPTETKGGYTEIDVSGLHLTVSGTGQYKDRKTRLLPQGSVLCVPYGTENFADLNMLNQGYNIPIPKGSYMKFQGAGGVIHHFSLPTDSLISK